MAYNNNTFIIFCNFLGKKFGQASAGLFCSVQYLLRSHGDTHWWMSWFEEAKMTLLTCLSAWWGGLEGCAQVELLTSPEWRSQGSQTFYMATQNSQRKCPKKQAVRAPNL